MKHLNLFLTLLAALLWPFAGSSAPVRVERAQAKAAAFFAQSGATRSVPELRLVWDGETAGTRSAADPALYIFNRTDAPGFVIMAGDDGVSPVLAYSFENRFGDVNNMPDNLRWWLEGMRDMIRSAREKGELATADAGWSAPTLTASDEIELLETALWDQDAPYNNECPYYSGTKRAVTGCIQTAEAIVMKYHRWPETVNKTVDGYTTYTRKIKVDGRTLGSYNWDLMPNTYQRGKYSDEEAAEVARLMADLGVLNQADYNAETGATSSDQYVGLVTVLGFDKSASLVSRPGYSDEEWAEMMRNEINAGRPVLYSGVGKQGGHAFVLSGYSKEEPLKFYFNWGWSGDSNGLYSVAKIGSDHPFPTWQDAIVGLKPDKTGTSQYSDHLELGAGTSNTGATFIGLDTNATKFGKNESFNLQFGFVFNLGAVKYNGKVALAVYTRDGKFKDFLSIAMQNNQSVTEFPYSVEAGYGNAWNLTCTIPCALAPGDRLYGLFWNNGTGEWERLRAYDEDTVDSILLMAEPETPAAIAAATSLAYDREKKQFTLQTIAELACRVVAADGSVKLDQTTSADPLTIDASKWAAGSYVLTLTPADGESYTLRLVL